MRTNDIIPLTRRHTKTEPMDAVEIAELEHVIGGCSRCGGQHDAAAAPAPQPTPSPWRR